MASDLDRLAAANGILRSYMAIDKTPIEVPDSAVLALLDVLGAHEVQADSLPPLPEPWPPPPSAPERVSCYLPAFLQRGRAWGVTCQLYGLRSARNWGVGDFEDLARLGELAAGFGADFLGVNPLHALFLADPQRSSPFSPSHRNFLNPLYIAVDRVRGFDPRQDLDEPMHGLADESGLIDYRAVAQHKLTVLRRIHDRMRSDPAGEAFGAFVREGGESLQRYALFEALSLWMVGEGRAAGWHAWPKEYQEPESEAVARFARDRSEEVEFQLWLQWQADDQLGEVARRLRTAGMRIGLYLDLAVGTAPDGAATWSDRSLTVVGAQIGAPPDMFNPLGQSWGLAPVSPAEMEARDFLPMREAFDCILRHAGALRIDHAMSVYRLFWIPEGFAAAAGAYVLYPMTQLLQVLAKASQDDQAMIIGEDLGVVPEGFREEMERINALGYRIFYFERDEEDFLPPSEWPRSALACVGSHDTTTLAGWWTASDIELREKIGLFEPPIARKERAKRREEKRQALALLHFYGYEGAGEEFDAAVASGVHGLVARSPACLMAAQMEDLLGLVEQANVPGTVGEHPNWRRRLPVALEELEGHPLLRAILETIAAERPRL